MSLNLNKLKGDMTAASGASVSLNRGSDVMAITAKGKEDDDFKFDPSKSLRSMLESLRPYDQIPSRSSRLEEVSDSLSERLSTTPYTRMVFVFKYSDDETLSAINNAVCNVNMDALPDIQGSMRSYSFTAEEIQAANTGRLDVVCGFTVIDDEVRVVVIEGLGKL
jgi:hypothetical protein